MLHLILEVGTSESNSFTSGVEDVCNLAPETLPDCGSNCNCPPDMILTLAP